MITLCNIVVKSLENNGIKCQTFHPHELGIIGTTSDFEIKQSNLDKLFENTENVSITHGDVVVEKSPKMFGILSGDDIAVKIIYEAKKRHYSKLHMIFAMTNAPGVMTLPPDDPKVR